VPFGRDLAVWFFNSDEAGCTAYDSDYGRNFHFAIAPPADPVIHFRSDWSDSVEGTLRGAFLVDYDPIRLPSCRGFPSWELTAHARFDDGSTADAPIAGSSHLAAPARFTAPSGAHAVALWFENRDASGCDDWDSDYGRNFTFAF
jgi:hypothetical protein